MSFLSILLALLIEQARPLKAGNRLEHITAAWMDWTTRTFDAGERRQAWVTWSLLVGIPALAILLVEWLLGLAIGWPAMLAWHVAVLYATLGFRQFSHHFTAIRDALEAGDEDKARQLLATWQNVQVGQIPRSEIVRHVIEHSVLAAHRHVFGVLMWFALMSVIGLGPGGAVVYALAGKIQRQWPQSPLYDPGISPVLASVAQRAWRFLDWLPARATALAFAVVGRFEDAMDGWRHHAQQFPDDNDGVILAATAGAIDIRLGGAALHTPEVDVMSETQPAGAQATETTPGRTPELAHFAQVVGLVWRTVVLWLVLVALLTMANLLG
jgi:adenosylcobinamide-phosphate synthase